MRGFYERAATWVASSALRGDLRAAQGLHSRRLVHTALAGLLLVSSVSLPACNREHDAHVASSGVTESEVAYYTCPMHPSVRSAVPGACPICGMDLVAVGQEELETGTIHIDAERRRAIGVETAIVEPRAMSVTVRAVGKVRFDETQLSDVTLKYRGWIGELHVDRPGQSVKKGEPLFTLYSPELYSAQQEYLSALESQTAARSTSAPERANYLVEAAAQRLHFWDLEPWQIKNLATTREALEYIPILAPASGFVAEKNVVSGSVVEPGVTLYRIAGLDEVWVEADVYEAELPLLAVGDTARILFPYLPGRSEQGRIAFIYPYLDATSRTGRIRIELPNPDLALKPDMYASVEIHKELGEGLAIPTEAVLYTGTRRFVFVDLGEDRLEPREIEIGMEADQFVQVSAGLEPGERVVTSSNFLIAAEARLKLAMEEW